MKRNFWKGIAAAAGMIFFLTACTSAGGGSSKGIFGDKKDLPEDTPWNHGYSAIMETEYGWYTTGLGEDMCLRFYDKETKTTFILCNKPECMHDGGDQCEATYQNMKIVNACLYEGFIYLLGWQGIPKDESEEYKDSGAVVNLSLYRAALDGSSIDKVGTVFEADNLQNQKVGRRTRGILFYDQDDNAFIIHKGFAYISYYLQLGGGSVGLRGGGLLKMDLSTGTTQEIETVETLQQQPPAHLTGVSDYVYYEYFDSKTRESYWKRYVISENKTQAVDPLLENSEEKYFEKDFAKLDVVPCFSADRSYWLVRTYQEGENGQLAILAVDVNTQQVIQEESFETDIAFDKRKYKFSPINNGYYRMLLYDGKIMIADVDNVFFYDKEGQKLGEIAIPKEKLKWNDAEKQMRLEFKICNDKLWLVFGNRFDTLNLTGTGDYHRVLSCPLGDVYAGTGEWKSAYRIQGEKTYEDYLREAEEALESRIPEDFSEESRQRQIQVYRERLEQSLQEED